MYLVNFSNNYRPSKDRQTIIDKQATIWIAKNIQPHDTFFASASIQKLANKKSPIEWNGDGSELAELKLAQPKFVLLPNTIIHTMWENTSWVLLNYEQVHKVTSDQHPLDTITIWQRKSEKPLVSLEAYIPDRFRLLGFESDNKLQHENNIQPINGIIHLQRASSAIPLENINIITRISTLTGQVVFEGVFSYSGEKTLLSLTSNETFTIPIRANLPLDLEKGVYKLDISFTGSQSEDFWPILQNNNIARLDRVFVSHFVVESADTSLPLAVNILNEPFHFGSEITLNGHSLTKNESANRINVNLVWQATNPPPKDYTVFTQLLDLQNNFIANHDGQPDNNLYPTSSWGLGEQSIQDSHELMLPANLPNANYQIIVGMYSLETGERLLIYNNKKELLGDFIKISEVNLP